MISKQENRCISADSQEISKTASKVITSKLKWAIIALTKPGRNDILERNQMLSKYLRPYANKYDLNILYFSEIPFPQAARNKYITPFKDIADIKFIDTSQHGFNLKERFGYKYMCKFFALDLYEYLKDYDYYMRCDSDCYIKALNYDVFGWIHLNQVEYGFAVRKLEAHGPTKSLMPTWVSKYMGRCQLQASSPMDRPISTCFNFYNNWHIGRVSFFTRPDVKHFLLSVNESGHILTDRWGDSSIQAYAVRIFMDESKIRQVPNFTYEHGSHSKYASTFGKGETDVPQALGPWRLQ